NHFVPQFELVPVGDVVTPEKLRQQQSFLMIFSKTFKRMDPPEVPMVKQSRSKNHFIQFHLIFQPKIGIYDCEMKVVVKTCIRKTDSISIIEILIIFIFKYLMIKMNSCNRI